MFRDDDEIKIFYEIKEKIGEKEVISPKEMAIIDENAEYLGINRLMLMENAGRAVYEEIKDKEGEFIIFCGVGNNGGDGFVVARHLNKATVILLGKEDEIKTYEARENFKILKNLSIFGNIKIREIRHVNEICDIFERLKEGKYIIIDAMLGTGQRGELREPYKSVVSELNKLKERNKELFIVSVDVETGDLKIDLTVTFHKKKNLNKNAIIKDIGIPKEAEWIVGFGDIKALNLIENKHKGKNGKVLIIGGSKDYFGAPILAGLAALKIVDIVGILSVDKVIRKITHPEFILYSLEGDYVNNVDYALEVADGYDVVVIGNGLSVNEKTKDFVNEFINNYEKKLVIDADAIKVINYHKFDFREDVIFTPHKKEFNYIKFSSIPESTILLKGKKDIIFNSKNVKINLTGNKGMTKGGTGDVLAGLTGAIFAKNDPFISACSSAFINGYAADLLLKEKGSYYTPIDIINKIPNVLRLIK
ncbi:carbohydrate kinase, YjeF related protein [Methanocaldococcus villosus KIN24-T80]|uniref:Bifunctional NAD(P)H-hydrate repair enzyme n=1 Tax=Methanocaldococcus villosus KIN24-T80 TaxID=1069083 RepID=N6VZZ6_9EURY|nr:bifunctional ADP-dependent NAD(P)H-hydrate dehydratase/NAD(P)H-hydrate epimerase [Methanocaldococcus villosus]ENN96667.1 carbohydrate kinase, YjeF related protein [Methanocaldococcus villosus KIN24-T80]